MLIWIILAIIMFLILAGTCRFMRNASINSAAERNRFAAPSERN